MPKPIIAIAPTAPNTSEPLITVTAQQSRYHVDALDAPTTNEIEVRNLSISIGQKEIISSANLHLQPGGHYVLVGQNGTGKSTLLKAIAEGRVPSIAWKLRVLLLGQTTIVPDKDGELRSYSEETVLQHVLRSDRERERLLKEADALSSAMDSKSLALLRMYRCISHEGILRRLREARQIYERRSGARGAMAKKELMKLEEEVVASRSRLAENLNLLDPAQIGSETQAASNLFASIQTSLELMDAPAAEAKARTVLHGLGFSQANIDGPIKNLSGGWQTRCDIACALSQYCDVLLLDEPTNYLDLPSIIWLQSYVDSLTSTTIILVTHDRDFADALASDLLILRNQVIEPFKGNLSTYERERQKKAKWMTRLKDAQEKQKAHMQATISNNVRAAKKSGDDNKLKQAASRQKKLDERMGLQVSAKGGRFKLNRDLLGYHTIIRDAIDVPDFDPPVRLVFPTQPADLRFPGPLVSIEGASLGYGPTSPPVLTDVNLTIHANQRLALVGLNGAGKSTLVSLLCGYGPATCTKGSIARHSRLLAGLFSQQAVEELSAGDPAQTALSHLMHSHPSLSEQEARALLAGLGLRHPAASTVPLALLSGGQKVRLALAKVLAIPPQLLILDEVTTHLDSDTVTALAAGLKRYNGAVVVVSHDRWFVRVVVEGQTASSRRAWDEAESGEEESSGEDDEVGASGVVYRMCSGNVKVLVGGMDKYEEIAARATVKPC